ncbi:MAG: hypothetical protein HY721_14410 [Planctomycetes bacterium]|nr:hypothetical protein [Planctomycetota bacterium]
MLRRALQLLLSAAIAAGGVLPAWVLYDCPMTGRKGMAACCCSAARDCRGEPAQHEPRGGPRPGLRDACCVATQHRSPARELRRSPGDQGSWERALGEPRLQAVGWASPAAKFCPPERSAGARALGGASAPASGSDPPLYLVHRALLI